MKFSAVLSALGLAASAAAASLQQVTNFGSNPSNVKMFIYVPDKVAANPPIVVAIHYCTGTAKAYFNGSPYKTLADQKGFIVIYPESPYSGTCWDVSSKATLTHNGGGNSNSIANMVTYALDKYKGNKSKVFVTGSSSGAMMTNVMAATYPELFTAGIVYNGVPAGCFYTGSVNGWNSTCAHGNVKQTASQWAQQVFNADPGYKGSRPRMQIYHGSVDATLYPANYQETIKQWSGVFGYNPDKPTSSKQNTPQTNYRTDVFGDHLTGVWAVGVGHTVPIRGADDMKFFGL
ncbi:PHB depolymerase family esterase [Colletotrichum tofieldiae]|uniref:Carboxylic ester hydrolase n=1 Tax=Colletotrichum tofieldiae TaxID=708197 RepID=A0A166T3Z4_9PEZI|nr:PHB depolymerase family esterase [Colletotrichum tofieldiae]GKT88878.1 PHB depolymerase family esterase [Colletotrichum tofieldiae]